MVGEVLMVEKLNPSRVEYVIDPRTGYSIGISRSYPFLHLSQILGERYSWVLKTASGLDQNQYVGPDTLAVELIRRVCQAPWRWVIPS